MAFSAATMAMVTLNSELDVTSLVVYRDVLKKASKDKKEIPSYNAILVFLTARVLKEFPYMNASFTNTGIKLINVINLGLAVDTSEGLMVVVVRNADRKSVDQIHKELYVLAERAQNQRSAPEDLKDSTFTITNLGIYGIDDFTPIINPPEAAILGVCRFVEKDVLFEGQNKRRTMANFSLTFDHRVIDGGPAARFLQRLGELIAKFEHIE
jgi:pyruvate dehydrogenase E2 component (dihydrolipoamide acetyltransferase)